jgi:hypothetical protein
MNKKGDIKMNAEKVVEIVLPLVVAKKPARTVKPKTGKTGKTAKTARKPKRPNAPKEPRNPRLEARPDSKKTIVLELLRRHEGATTAEIAKATNWQNHTIRGFISGNVTKKMGLAVESSKNEAGERTYRIVE